jgi:FixJ family two-component response regulator
METNGASIFIIEDDNSVRRALTRVMVAAGFQARGFASAEEFLADSASSTKGCVVADLTLPGMSGLELGELLHQRQDESPVILLTAQDTPELRAEARAAGAVGFFRKPVDSQALLDAIAWSLEKNMALPAS